MAKEKTKDKDNEKVYTIPLRDAWKGPCKKRAKKCMYVIREFVKRHMKTEKVKIGTALNHEIWKRGIKNPPRKLKVQVVPHEDVVWVELQGVKLELVTKEEKKKETAPEKKGTEEQKQDKEKPKTAPVKKKEPEKTKPASSKKEKEPEDKKQDPSKKLPSKAKVR